ncbi:MAG: hypothetical protein KGK12_06255 [Armatimonadetes bacterium]|nr:hypothetical protein [Armatimonadota bacterium]
MLFACILAIGVATAVRAQAPGKYNDRHDFGGTVINAAGTSGPDGYYPFANVTFDNAGNMVGTAYGNGALYSGMVWEITAAGSYRDLHDFGGTVTDASGTSGPDGQTPETDVTLDSAGNMYGTAVGGGPHYSGMVWEITAAGTYVDLHDFGGTVSNANGSSGPDGSSPLVGVSLDGAGNMYGTTSVGGAYNANSVSGMVWEITAAGAYRDLHDFGGTITNSNGASGPDGNTPYARVSFDSAGNMYGTTNKGGGNSNYGMVWEITSAGAYRDLHDFGGIITNANGSSGPDGYYPRAGVTFDAAGNMYGTASYGGAYGQAKNAGMVWEITSAGAYRDIHDFGATVTNANGSSGPDGYYCVAGVTFDTAGNMYGTTFSGGAYDSTSNSGMVWEITFAGAYRDLHDFGGTVTVANGNSGPDGYFPRAGVTFDAVGNMYGACCTGGAYNSTGTSGMVWELAPPPVLISLSPSSALVGSGAFTLTVNGTGFQNGAIVRWNGSALTTSYVSSTEIRAAVPAANLSSAGFGSVTAVNPRSNVSNALTFTIDNPAPILTGIAPLGAQQGSPAVAVTLKGSGFVSTSTADWEGAPLTTTFVSGTSLTAVVPNTDLMATGTFAVTVSSPAPGGGTSSAAAFTVVSPIVLSVLSPWSVTAASRQLPVRVFGSGFTSDCRVYWNGAALTSSFVSGTEVDGMIPAADLTAVGSFPVTVQDSIGVVSQNSLTFNVTAPFPIHLVSVAIKPAAVTGGGAATGSVFLSGNAPAGGADVRLSSSHPGVAGVPRFVFIPAGTSTATFRVRTMPQSSGAACRITGTYLTVSRSALLTVNP